MAKTSANPEHEIVPESELAYSLAQVQDHTSSEETIAKLMLLWSKRGFLLRVILAGLLLGLLVAFLLPRRYESTAQLMPPDSQSGSLLTTLAAISGRAGGGTGIASNLAGSILGLQTSGAVFVGILQSRSVQDDLIDRFDLKKVYGLSVSEKARKKLVEYTNVIEDRKSGIITITVTDSSPERAAAIAQGYIEELNRSVSRLNTSSAHRERVFLEERLTEVKKELEVSEKELGDFSSKNTTIDIKEQGKAMVEAAAELQAQLIAAEAQSEGLRQIYTDNNTRVRETQARIDELKHQLTKLGGTPGTAGGNTSSGDLYPAIRQLPLLGVTYADLYRRTKVAEGVYEILTQQYELAKVQEAKEIPSVKVLDAPIVPERRSFPPRLMVTLLLTILVAMGGVGWVLGRARWEQIDSQNPWKALALELGATMYQSPWSHFVQRKLGRNTFRLPPEQDK